MKKTALAILLLAAGCGAPASKPDTPIDDVRFEAMLAQQIAFDATRLKLGDFALYTVKVAGEKQTGYVKYAVVAQEGTSLWIENKVPGAPRPWVIKSKIQRDGKLVEQWRGEAGTRGPARVYPPKGEQAKDATPARRDSSQAKAASQTSREQITVGGQTFDCTKIITTLSYSGGRTSRMTNWCADSIPFSLVVDSKSYGGLVKRQFGRLTMELVSSGNSTPRPELRIPSR